MRKEVDGRVEWECTWENFGGWRWSSKAASYEILDRSGNVAGQFRIGSSGQADVPYFKRELDRNTPEGGPTPERLRSAKPRPPMTLGRCLVALLGGLALGFTGLGLHWFIVDAIIDPNDGPAAVWFRANTISLLLPALLYLAGFLFSAIGVMGLVGRSISPLCGVAPRRPVFGPALGDFRLDRRHRLEPVEILEGKEYGYVDPEAIRSGIRSTRGCLLLLAPLCLSFPLFLLLPIPEHPLSGRLGDAGVICLFAAAFGVSMLWASRRMRRLEAVLGDRIRLEGGTLIVVSPEGERRYDWPGRRTVTKPLSYGFLAHRYELGEYWIDPRYLIELPPEADIQEMAEMRDRIEDSV
ncbi:MAG: hypothetical protein ACHQ50_12530 [Fimbriimonadales bacterium]